MATNSSTGLVHRINMNLRRTEWDSSTDGRTFDRSQRIKLALIGLSLSFVILVPIKSQWMQSQIMNDVYWRYQGKIIANSIQETGQIPVSFPHHSFLMTWVNGFVDEFFSPLIIVMFSEVTGMSLKSAMFFPLFTFPWILAQGSVAKALIGRTEAFPIAVGLAVSYKFTNLSLISAGHRVSLGWALFFILVLYLLVSRNRKTILSTAGFVAVTVAFVASYRTLSISMLLFFSTLCFLGYLWDQEIISVHRYLLFLSITVTYYVVVFSWMGGAVLKSISSFATVGVTGYGNVISVLTQKASTSQLLDPYLSSTDVELWYQFLIFHSRVTAVVLLVSAALATAWLLLRERKSSVFDVFLLAVVIQGAVYFGLLPFFAGSAGISPRFLALNAIPVLGTFPILVGYRRLRGRVRWRTAVSIGVIVFLIISGPAYALTTIRPYSEGLQASTVSESIEVQTGWIDEYGEGRVISDFNTLSAYYALGGDSPTYLPPTGSSYSSDQDASRLLRTYYQAPVKQFGNGEFYLVSQGMTEDSMVHLGSLTTVPNPDLHLALSRSNSWNKVYTNGNDRLFMASDHNYTNATNP